MKSRMIGLDLGLKGKLDALLINRVVSVAGSEYLPEQVEYVKGGVAVADMILIDRTAKEDKASFVIPGIELKELWLKIYGDCREPVLHWARHDALRCEPDVLAYISLAIGVPSTQIPWKDFVDMLLLANILGSSGSSQINTTELDDKLFIVPGRTRTSALLGATSAAKFYKLSGLIDYIREKGSTKVPKYDMKHYAKLISEADKKPKGEQNDRS